MKLPRLLLLSFAASLAFAQQTRQDDENSTQWSPVTLAGEFLEHDFVNWFAFANGVYDSYAPISGNNRVSGNGSLGWEVGGGVSATHAFRNGDFSLSYRGDYRDYQSSFYSSGTDQNLGVAYIKRLARRWTLSASLNGGIVFYGGSSFFSNNTNATVITSNNPFSTESRYLSAGASISYQQSRRLSYVLSGNYFLQAYTYNGSVDSRGTSGSGSVYYRTTARTTLGATYSHTYFTYQGDVGTANGDTVQASVSHLFPNHWTVSVAGGFTRSDVTGTSVLPASLLFQNIGPGFYFVEHFHQSTIFPSFSGTVSRSYRHSNLYATGGQGLSSGNGYYLASKSFYANGVYSIAIRQRQSLSFSGVYSRLSSVSNTVANAYVNSSLTAAYGVNVIRYFGLNARYDYVRYGTLNPNPSISDNRLSFGITFSSKSIPLTLF